MGIRRWDHILGLPPLRVRILCIVRVGNGRVTVGARVNPSAGDLAIVTVTATAIAVRDQGPPFAAYDRLS